MRKNFPEWLHSIKVFIHTKFKKYFVFCVKLIILRKSRKADCTVGVN